PKYSTPEFAAATLAYDHEFGIGRQLDQSTTGIIDQRLIAHCLLNGIVAQYLPCTCELVFCYLARHAVHLLMRRVIIKREKMGRHYCQRRISKTRGTGTPA